MAAMFPVDPKTVERWEKAQSAGALDMLEDIARVLETTPDSLMAEVAALAQEEGENPVELDLSEQLQALAEGQAEIRKALSQVLIALGATATAEAPVPDIQVRDGDAADDPPAAEGSG